MNINYYDIHMMLWKKILYWRLGLIITSMSSATILQKVILEILWCCNVMLTLHCSIKKWILKQHEINQRNQNTHENALQFICVLYEKWICFHHYLQLDDSEVEAFLQNPGGGGWVGTWFPSESTHALNVQAMFPFMHEHLLQPSLYDVPSTQLHDPLDSLKCWKKERNNFFFSYKSPSFICQKLVLTRKCCGDAQRDKKTDDRNLHCFY